MGVYGPHTQFKCLLEAMIFGTCKKNIIMYSQMRFQPYQSHSLTVQGLKVAKSPNTGSLGARQRPQCGLQIKASDLKFVTY